MTENSKTLYQRLEEAKARREKLEAEHDAKKEGKNTSPSPADDEERAKLLTQMQMFNTQQTLGATRNMLEGAETQSDAFLAQSKARNPQLWASKAAEDIVTGTAKVGNAFTPVEGEVTEAAKKKYEDIAPEVDGFWERAKKAMMDSLGRGVDGNPTMPQDYFSDYMERRDKKINAPYSERVIRSTFAALDEIPRDSEGRYLINGMAFTRDELMPSMQREVTAALHPQLMATSVGYRNDYAKSLGYRDFNAYIDETIINPLKALDAEIASEAVKKVDDSISAFPEANMAIRMGVMADAETKGRKEIRDAIDAMESLKRGDWSAAFAEGFDFLNFATLGVSSLGSDFNQIRMLNKVKNGEELTSEEQRMYDIYKITQNANALRKTAPQTLWQDIWRGIGTTAQLSSQFIPVMGVASSVANLSKVGVKAGIGLTQRALRQGVVKGVMTGIKQTGRVAGKLGLNVLKANWAGLVVSPLQMGTYSTFLQKREEQFKVVDGKLVYTPTKAWKDVVDTLIEQTNEISSEVLGAGIADVVGVSFKSLGKMIGLDKVINGVSSKLGLGASYNKIFGLKKSDAFKALERRLSYTGDPVSEGLSEIWGDISSNLMKMCITGTEDFSKLRDPKYWATNLAVAGIYGATLNMAHSAASLPTYAEIAHLGKAKHQALRNISSKELKDALRIMGVDETVNEAAFRLAQLDWSNFSPTDRANAMDFLRAESQQQILIGVNEENNFMARFTPVAASIQQHAYRGKEGDADTGLLYEGTLEDGSKVSIISGDMTTESNADNLLMVMDKDGNITPMARSKFKEFSAYRMGDVITAQYQRMYGTEAIKNELTETEETFEALEQPTPKEAMEYMRKLNIPIPEEGEKVKLVDGREGMFLGWNADGSLNVEAQKADDTYELLVMPFHKILSAQGNIAQVQQEMLAGETLSAAEEAIETETPEAEVTPEAEAPEEAQVEIATAIEESQNDVAGISAVPMTEDGDVDFGAITDPALYAKMYVRELGSTEVAIEDVSKMRSMSEQSILKLEEKRETLATANERIANRKEVEATKTRIAFYDAVLDILSPKETMTEPVAETAEVETPVAETPVAEVETPTMETPTFYEGDIVEHNGRKAEVVENRGDGTYVIDYKMSDNAANQDTDIVDGAALTKAQDEVEAAENTVGIVDNAESRKIADDVYNTVNRIAKSLGITVEFVPIVVNSEGQAVNGLIDGKKVLISSQFASECVNWLTGHEFLHYMKEVAPEQYAKYVESVKSYLGEEEWNKRMEKQKALYLNHKMTEKANDEALMTEECVADFTGEMVEENDAFNNYLNTVKEEKGLLAAIKRVLRAIGKLFTGKHKKRVNEMLKQVNALIAAAEKANVEGVNVDAQAPIEVIESAERLEEKGGVVDVQRGDAKFALADVLTISEQEQAIQDLMRVTGRSRATVQKYIKAEQSLARFILSGDNAAYLDYEADDSVPSIWENSDYPQGTVEFSNICRKRLPLTMIYQKLQKEFPNTKFNKTQLETIRQTLIANGIDVACGLCFVEDRRQHNDEIGQGFIDALSGKDVYVNANQQKAIDKLRESGDNYIPNLYELLTLDGMKKLRMEHPDVANAFIKYNNARGQQAGRLFQAYSAYHREILKFNNARVKKTNDVGGLRIFSFSDFEAHHLIDLVQVLTDCARKGIKVQGYTKVPEFALAVKDTGMKLNRSLIAKDNGVVEADYSAKTGEAVSPNVIDGKRLLLDTVEGIDVNDKNFFDSSTSKNVGNILVGVNDEQIRIAMLDPFVDYIIPFHTGLSADILKQKGISDWKNYKYEQIEKTIVDGKMVNAKTHINIYTDVLSDDIKTEKQFVERYLEVCKEKNLVPKFARFLNRDKAGDFVYTKGYYKFLLDFKMFDAKGRILPQEVVQPIFNDEVNKQILDDYVKGEKAKAPNEKVYEEVKEALGLGEKFSLIGEQGAEALDRAEEATTRLRNLNIARQMEAQGKDALSIKMATNWERGTDGLWRYEMDDYIDSRVINRLYEFNTQRATAIVKEERGILQSMYDGTFDLASVVRNSPSPTFSDRMRSIYDKYKDMGKMEMLEALNALSSKIEALDNGSALFTLEEVLGKDHPVLNAYPQLSDVSVLSPKYKRGADLGYYDHTNKTIMVRTYTGNTSVEANTLVHEIQHAIQHIEGFATGGNRNSVNPYAVAEKERIISETTEKLEAAKNLKAELETRNAEIEEVISAWENEHRDDDEKYPEDIEDMYYEQEGNKETLKTLDRDIRGYERDLRAANNMHTTLGNDNYYRLAGEVEARTVAKRRTMTPEQRRSSLAVNDSDVAPEDRILIREHKMMSPVMRSEDMRYSLSDRPTGLLNDFAEEFEALQKEYESLDPTTIYAQHPFRIRKRKVVQKYLNHVSEVLGLPCEVFVLDSSNEQQVRTAYRKYVASRQSNGNTSVATYEEFKKEISDVIGEYFYGTNMVIINIGNADSVNLNSEYIGAIIHENGHKIIEGMNLGKEMFEAIYEESQRLAPKQVEIINRRYPNTAKDVRGEELITFALQTRASNKDQKDMLMQFLEGDISVDDILDSFKISVPLRDKIIKNILIALQDGYNNKHNADYANNRDNYGAAQEETFRDRRGSKYNGDSRRDILAPTRYSLLDMPFFEDNGDIVSFEAMTPEERKMAKYEDAQRMTSEGADAQTILDATGWLETEDGWEYFGEADIDLTGDQDEMLRVGRWLQSKRAVKKSGMRKMYAELIKEQRGVIKDIKKREAEAFASRGSIKAQVEALLQGQAPESLPIEDQVLVDIARGQRLKWKDGNGKRGLSTELGLTNARAEKMGAVTIGATDYLEDYVAALMERNNGYENDINDNDIRNAVIEMFRSYPSPKRAVDELYGRYATSTAVSEAEEGLYRLEVERDNALAEIDAEHTATMANFEANPAPFIRDYNESASWQAEIDLYTNSLRKAKSTIDRMTTGRATESANRKSKAEAVRSLKTFINNMLRGDLARYTHKRDIVALMKAVNESTTIYQMQRAVNKAMESAYNIRLRKEVARMNNLTKMRIVLNETNLDPQIFLNNMVRDGKMTAGAARTILNNYWRGVNASGVAIAKGVDGDTSEIMAFIHENIDLAKLGEDMTVAKKCNELRDAVEGDRTLDEELKAKKIASVDIIEEYLTLQQMINALREINGSEKPIEQTIAQQATEIAKLNNELRALEMQKEAITRTDRGYKSRKTAIEQKLAELRNAYNTARAAQEQAYASYYGSMPDIIERLYQANTSVEKLLKDGIVELSRQKQAEADHRNELIGMALEDINRPEALVSDKVDYTLAQKAHDSGVGRLVTSHLNSLDHMLRRAGENAPNGEGRLWRYFVPKLLDAYNRLFDEQQACADTMNKKCKQLFGKDYNKVMMKAERVVIGTRDEIVSGKVKSTDITIAQALNIIATWDQADGRASLEKQGYTEEKIQALIAALDANNPKWMAFEQWVVHTFLPSRREKYNKVHRAMFGVNMNKEINYFPIRRDKGALYQNVDLTEANFDVLPSTITGSIIQRTKSTAKIDLDNSFFEVLRDHIVDMEKWAEIAPITKDFNTMLSSKAVQAVMNAKGKHFLDQFKEAAKIATLNFTGNSPEYEKIFMPIVNRMWASSLLAFKPYTALKQLASSVMFAQYSADPRFVGRLLYYYVGGIAPLPDSVFLRIGKGEVEPQPQKDALWNIQWAKKNSAMFRERWESVAAGNEAFTRQIKYNTKLGKFIGEGIKDFTTLGMRMIAFVDAYTSAAGMRAVYDVTYRNLKEKGASHEEAHKEAMFRAEIAVNKTQQSSQFIYLSPIQMSRGVESMLATFNNAPFAQGRLIAESWAELIRNPEEERRVIVNEEAEWLKAHQYARAYAEIEEQIAAEKANGTLSPEDENKRREELQRVLNASVRAIAEKKAPKIMRGHKVRAALALVINAYIAQFAFNAMGVLPYMFFGDDDEKKKQLLKDVALWSLAGPLSTVPLGNAVISAFQGFDFQPLGAYGDFVDDINKIVKEAQKNGFNADVALMTADFLARKAVGIDYKTYFNLYAGLDSLVEDGYSHEALLKMLNAPNSQVRLLAGEHREGETAKESITRILRLYAILDDNIYEDNYADGKYTGNNRPVTMSKAQMRNLMPDNEREFRSAVLRRKAGYVKRAEIDAIDEEYAKVMEAMGWTANSKPNKKAFESGKYEAPVSGVRIEEYRKLASLATRVANAYDKTSRYIGDDEGKYYDYILAEMQSKRQLINEFNKAINTK